MNNNSNSKWRSKSNEKSNILSSSQKISNKAKATAAAITAQIPNQQQAKGITSSSKQSIDPLRGKTPDTYNNKPKV